MICWMPARSMRTDPGQKVEDGNTSNDEPHANKCPQVKLLAMENPGDGRHKHDAESSPDSVGNPHRDGLQCEGQEVKSKPVTGDNHDGRNQPAETMTGLQRRSRNDFTEDCNSQEQPVLHANLLCCLGEMVVAPSETEQSLATFLL